jgi:uncharacterized membrane protein
MNKQAYLTALRRTLSGLSREQIDDIARDYEQHFADAAMSGRSESDTCRALGDPRKIGLEFKAATHFAAFQRRHSLFNLARLAAVLLGLGAFNMFVLPVMLVAPLLLITLYLCSACCFVGGAALAASGLFSTDKIMFDHVHQRSALVLVRQTDSVLSLQSGFGFQVSPYAISYIEEPLAGQRIEEIGETPSEENIKTVIGALYLLSGYALYIFSQKLTRYFGKIVPRYLAANAKIVRSTIK